MTQETVLSKAVLGHESLLKQAGMVLGGSLLIALAAQISVPFYPVPMTLQVLAILIVGLTFGSRLGAITLMAYLAEGAMGLPVFANGGAGLAYMAGPTAGFLIGFVGMAWAAGYAVERGWAKGFLATALCCIVISALLYVPGAAWPMYLAEIFGATGKWVGSSAGSIWTYWMSPFLIGDAVKSIMAALIVAGGWKAIKG